MSAVYLMSVQGPFRTKHRLHFRQADPAGIMFFAEAFQLAHDTYEEFLEYLGFSYQEWFTNPEWAVPIRTTEADYRRPMVPPHLYEIEVAVEDIGETSMALRYSFLREGELHAEVRLVHVFINKERHQKMAIPSRVRHALETYQRQCVST